MKITQIAVTSGRKFPHPAIDFANLMSTVTLTATLGDDENADEATVLLQSVADGLVDDHAAELTARNRPQPRPTPAIATANTAAQIAARHK